MIKANTPKLTDTLSSNKKLGKSTSKNLLLSDTKPRIIDFNNFGSLTSNTKIAFPSTCKNETKNNNPKYKSSYEQFSSTNMR